MAPEIFLGERAWLALVAFCLILAACRDVAARSIPNRLSLCIAGLAVPARLAEHDLRRGLVVAAVTFGILTAAWMGRLIGGGDVKLWAGCALLLRPDWLVQGRFALAVVLVGGVLATLYLVFRLPARHLKSPRGDMPLGVVGRAWRAELWRARRGGSIPYGVAIATAALLMIWRGG